MRSVLTTTAVLAAFYANLSAAMPWLEPVETPMGLMAAVGFSPLPTGAPGLGPIPRELLRKQNELPYPPPVNWCGLIGGNPADVLSCVSTKYCVYSGPAMGCCDAGFIETCTNLFTTCANYGDNCNSACEANQRILKCSNAARPYCGTYAFDHGTRNYNCDSTQGAAQSVESLVNYYITALGSQALPSSFGPIVITTASQVLTSNSHAASVPATSVSGTPVSNVAIQSNPPTSTVEADPNPTTHSGIGTGVIAGIAVGIVVVILAILAALVAWCCMRRRRRRQTDPVAAPVPEMQHHQTQPQQTQPQAPTYPPQQPTYPPRQPTYPPQQPTYPLTQQPYFNPAPASDPIKPTFNNNISVLPVPEADSTTAAAVAPAAGGMAYNDSKHDTGTGPPRYSVANAGGQTPPAQLHGHGSPQGVGGGVPTPGSDVAGAGAGVGDDHNEHPRPPQSPTLTEVEGSSLYGHGQRPGFGQGYSHGSGTVSPLTAGGGTGTGTGGGFGQGQGQGAHAHEVDGGNTRPLPGAEAGAGFGGVGGQGRGQGIGQGGYGGQGGVYEIGEGERRR